MKTISKRKSFASSVAFLLIASGSAFCQSGLVVPTNASQNSSRPGVPFAWPAGATVNVYIDTTAYQQGSAAYNAVVSGFRSVSSTLTTYSVTFNIIPIGGCPANPQGYYQTVTSTPMANNQVGLTVPTYGGSSANGQYQIILAADTTLADSVTSYTSFLQGTAAHEAMHEFGEGDCPNCDPNLTPMSYLGTPQNPGAISPTNYDVQTATYSYTHGGVTSPVCDPFEGPCGPGGDKPL